MSDSERTRRGVALTEELITTLGPIVDGQPSELVIEALAAAMMAAVASFVTTREGQRTVLTRFARSIEQFAETL